MSLTLIAVSRCGHLHHHLGIDEVGDHLSAEVPELGQRLRQLAVLGPLRENLLLDLRGEDRHIAGDRDDPVDDARHRVAPEPRSRRVGL